MFSKLKLLKLFLKNLKNQSSGLFSFKCEESKTLKHENEKKL